MTIRLRLFIGFALLILILAINFVVNQSLSKEVKKNISYLNASETILRNSDLLNKMMIDMQSGFRGYLLTGQEVFLTSYNDGIKSVPPLFLKQRSLVSSPMQKQKLDSIYSFHRKWVKYADALISTKKDTLPEASITYKELFETKLKKEVGKKFLGEIFCIVG